MGLALLILRVKQKCQISLSHLTSGVTPHLVPSERRSHQIMRGRKGKCAVSVEFFEQTYQGYIDLRHNVNLSTQLSFILMNLMNVELEWGVFWSAKTPNCNSAILYTAFKEGCCCCCCCCCKWRVNVLCVSTDGKKVDASNGIHHTHRQCAELARQNGLTLCNTHSACQTKCGLTFWNACAT